MDEFWEMVSKRIKDLAIVKKRLARQWDTVQHILMHDIPQDLQKFFEIQAKIQQERLDQMIEFAYRNLQTEWLFVQRNILTFLQFATHFLHNRWKQLQPKLDNLVQTSFAISTATSTLQLSVQITPIVLSAMTILATAPMLNAVLPDFLFNTTVIFFIMMGISAYAGYSKFKELE
ncbi:MAG TPA: hypothetical protein PLD88_09055, partial [Candidatus Berkiella sp.]|nr:hypothetical protein [Candidatus Berkiella sp.]